MKRVACYFCAAVDHAPYAEENGFELVKCAGCGLLYVSPRPDDDTISAAMRTGLHRGEDVLERIGAHDPRKIAGYQRILGTLLEGARLRGRWLDIGCGHGEMLEALSQRFPQIAAQGLEPCQPKAELARERGLTVTSEAPFEPASFDALSLLNVYSHLPDPVETLRDWSRWLRPGGSLILQTGDSCDLPLLHHHRPFDLPDHLSFANRRIVRTLLERLDFVVLRVHYERHGAIPGWQLWRRPYRDMWLWARKIR